MNQQPHDNVMEIIKQYTLPDNERNITFRNALMDVNYQELGENDANYLAKIYFDLKDIYLRNLILKGIVFSEKFLFEDFFLRSYKKERYLDMRLTAIRGYSLSAKEQQVEELMMNFIKILKKRQESTPNNYQEYAYLLSPAGFPYLINKYGYSVFIQAQKQTKLQYDAMDNSFKNRLTYDEKGKTIHITKSMRKSLIDK